MYGKFVYSSNSFFVFRYSHRNSSSHGIDRRSGSPVDFEFVKVEEAREGESKRGRERERERTERPLAALAGRKFITTLSRPAEPRSLIF